VLELIKHIFNPSIVPYQSALENRQVFLQLVVGDAGPIEVQLVFLVLDEAEEHMSAQAFLNCPSEFLVL
jgi:hypothetical protein